MDFVYLCTAGRSNGNPAQLSRLRDRDVNDTRTRTYVIADDYYDSHPLRPETNAFQRRNNSIRQFILRNSHGSARRITCERQNRKKNEENAKLNHVLQCIT